MSWENLPSEIGAKILATRYNMRNEACKKIQARHQIRQHLREQTAIDISLDIEIDENESIIVCAPELAIILDTCSHLINGNYNREYWLLIMEGIKESLTINHDVYGKELMYYMYSKQAYKKILEKLRVTEESIP